MNDNHIDNTWFRIGNSFVRVGEYLEYKTRQFFQARGIHQTLAEYREVYACMQNGSNPLGIH